jgi:hypothetical protein
MVYLFGSFVVQGGCIAPVYSSEALYGRSRDVRVSAYAMV